MPNELLITTGKPSTVNQGTEPKTYAVVFIEPKKGRGKPTVMTPTTLQKLEAAWAMGMPDDLACSYANISERSLYYYQEKNPAYLQRKKTLKDQTRIHVYATLAPKILNNDEMAKWWALHKMSAEFSALQKTQEVAPQLTDSELYEGNDDTIQTLSIEYQEKMSQALTMVLRKKRGKQT